MKKGFKILRPVPDDIVEDCSNRLNNPKHLKHPQIIEDDSHAVQTAYIDMSTGDIAIFQSFIDFLGKKGLDERTVLTGATLHEFGHYTHFPIHNWLFEELRWRMTTLKKDQYMRTAWDKMQKQFDFEKPIEELSAGELRQLEGFAMQRIGTVLNYYLDLLDNVNLMCKPKNVELREMYRALHDPIEDHLGSLDDSLHECIARGQPPKPKKTIDNFMIEVYNEYALPLGIKARAFSDEEIRQIDQGVSVLLGSDLDKHRQSHVLAFARIVEDLFKDDFKLKDGKCDGQGIKIPGQEGKGSKGQSGQSRSGQPNLDDVELAPEGMMDNHENNMDTAQSDRTLEDIAKKRGIGRYEVMRKFMKKADAKPVPPPTSIKGIGGADEEQIDLPAVSDTTIAFYQQRAAAYPKFKFAIPLAVSKADSFPMGVREWEDNPNKLDPVESRGLILPGYAQEHKFIPRLQQKRGYQTPSAIILVDSSGSERNPAKNPASLNALGGAIVAENYLRNERSVGVLNFSGTSFMLLPTKKKQDIYYALCMYQGGGTVVNLEKLYGLVKEMDKVSLDDLEKMSESEIQRRFSPEMLEKAKEKQVAAPTGSMDVYSNTDLWVFSDMGIMNLDDMIGLASLEKRRRMFFVSTAGHELDVSQAPNTYAVNVSKLDDLYQLTDLIKEGCAQKTSRTTGLAYRGRK